MSIQPTPEDIAKAWPWAWHLKKLLAADGPPPAGKHLLVASDYGGAHKTSRYVTYGFVLVDADLSPDWPRHRRRIREQFLPEGRRLSFTTMNDGHRRRALEPFLYSTDAFSGRCIGIVVHKDLRRMSTTDGSSLVLKKFLGLKANWSAASFESAVRLAHLFAVLIGAWSLPGMHVSWLTDEDEAVANEQRHSDFIELAAFMSSAYVPHDLGDLAVTTTRFDPGGREFEDFAALPDLVAGALAEAISTWSKSANWPPRNEPLSVPAADISEKANVIAQWLWTPSERLKKNLVLVDRIAPGRFAVTELRAAVEDAA